MSSAGTTSPDILANSQRRDGGLSEIVLVTAVLPKHGSIAPAIDYHTADGLLRQSSKSIAFSPRNHGNMMVSADQNKKPTTVHSNFDPLAVPGAFLCRQSYGEDIRYIQLSASIINIHLYFFQLVYCRVLSTSKRANANKNVFLYNTII